MGQKIKMARINSITGNARQEDALAKLVEKLETVRGLVNPDYLVKINPVKVQVFLELPNFPEIDIGNRGGFDMPHIRTYFQKGTRDTLSPPPNGKTPFDACLFGDEHVRLQGNGTWKQLWFLACIIP
jgi:hypothetical protein